MATPELQPAELARRIEFLESETYHLSNCITDAHRDIGVLFDRVETLTNGSNGQGELPASTPAVFAYNGDPLYTATGGVRNDAPTFKAQETPTKRARASRSKANASE